jgi:hypothetical protein
VADTTSQETVSGSCFCGAVCFEVTLPSLISAHCHCSMCRRSHGAGYVTWFTLPKAQWRVTAGEDDLTRYQSSEHGTRSFCRRCGSSLFFETTERPEHVDIVCANMHAAIDRPPQIHVHFDDRIAWVDVNDALPRLGGATGMEPI